MCIYCFVFFTSFIELSKYKSAFWRDDKLRQVSTVLTGQIEVCIRLNFTDGKPLLQECFGALLESITDDTLLKIVNMNILMHTRSEDPRVRLFALACSESLWRSQGGKLIGMKITHFSYDLAAYKLSARVRIRDCHVHY